MEPIVRDVTTLDEPHRRALEEVLGTELLSNQRLVIQVQERDRPTASSSEGDRPRQSLTEWTAVYDGLSEGQIDDIDRMSKVRAELRANCHSLWIRRCSIRTFCPTC